MISPLHLILALVGISFWLAMWANCIKRKSFSGAMGNRVFWMFSLALADPLMCLMYLILVIFKVGGGKRWTTVVAGIALVSTLAGWVNFMASGQTENYVRQEDGEWSKPSPLEFHTAVEFTESNYSSSTSNSMGLGVGVAPRHVQILLDGEGPGLRRAGRVFADALTDFPLFESIEVVHSDALVPGQRAPDLRLYLYAVETSKIPTWFRLSPWSLIPTHIEYRFEVTRWEGNGHSSTILSSKRFRPSMDIAGGESRVTFGFSMPGRRLCPEGSLANFAEKFTGALRDLLVLDRAVDAFPEQCFGTYAPPPSFAFLERLGARQVVSESDLGLHTLAVWNFTMPDWDEYERIRAELLESGFENGRGNKKESATTQDNRGDEWLALKPAGRYLGESYWSNDKGESGIHRPEIKGVPFQMEYRRKFSTAEKAAATAAIFDAGNIDLLVGWLSNSERLPAHLDAALTRENVQPRPSGILQRVWLASWPKRQDDMEYWTNLARVWSACGYEPRPGETSFASSLKSATERAYGKETEPPALTLQDYRNAGVTLIDQTDSATFECEPYMPFAVAVGAGDEPTGACFHAAPNEDGKLAITVLGVKPQTKAGINQSDSWIPCDLGGEIEQTVRLDKQEVRVVAHWVSKDVVRITISKL